MWKAAVALLFSIIAISFLFFVDTTTRTNNTVIKTPPNSTTLTLTPSPHTDDECKVLAQNILAMVSDANYCNSDSDCTPKIAVGYPADCSTLVNKNSNIQTIESTYLHFNNECNPPIYDCDRAPTQEEIKCIDNTCVDTRNN